jgi:pilus assembly protein Flp/PilA
MLQFQFVKAYLAAHIKSDRGASLVEYSLLVGLIAVVCIVAVASLGQTASSRFDSVQSSL